MNTNKFEINEFSTLQLSEARSNYKPEAENCNIANTKIKRIKEILKMMQKIIIQSDLHISQKHRYRESKAFRALEQMTTAPEVSKFQVDAADNDNEDFDMPYNVRGKQFNDLKIDDYNHEYSQIISFIENEMPSLMIEDSSDSSDYSPEDFNLKHSKSSKFVTPRNKENIKKNLLDYEFKLKQELRTLELEVGNKFPKKSHIFKFDDIKPFDFKQPLSCISKVKLTSNDYKYPYEGIKKFVEQEENLSKKPKRGSHFNFTIPKWIEFKDYIGENIEENDEDYEVNQDSTNSNVQFKSSLY
jgi:hypothetical protein